MSHRPQTVPEYVDSVVYDDDGWRERAACRHSSAEIVHMFTCTEDEEFEMFGQKVYGVDVQQYLVESRCHDCVVQWECARQGVAFEETEAGDRSTGAWAMLRRDRRWLASQPDALGLIDLAKRDNIPVAVMVTVTRAERG